MRTVSQIIGIWPSRQALADAIGAPVDRVHKWAQHGRIPGAYDLAIVRAAQDRGIALRLEDLAALRAAALDANNVTTDRQASVAGSSKPGAAA